MGFEFGTAQTVVGVVFAVLAIFFAGVFVVIALKANTRVPNEDVQRVGYRLRPRWMWTLATIGVVTLVASLAALPMAFGGAGDRTVVKVSSGQFYWIITPNKVPPGTHVRFEVTSVDVNHGFGLYTPTGRLIGSVQAMPGYTNNLDVTLDEPGRYKIRCFEFCGVNHSKMDGMITVGAK